MQFRARDWFWFTIAASLFVAFLWLRSGARPEQLPGSLVYVLWLFSLQVLVRWGNRKWQARKWRRREAELLDADGNPTLPGGVSTRSEDVRC